jgi:hypothetical protein
MFLDKKKSLISTLMKPDSQGKTKPEWFQFSFFPVANWRMLPRLPPVFLLASKRN